MVREQISKIAYKTLQQGKSIAGLAHKELSTRIMNLILPDSNLGNLNIDKNLNRNSKFNGTFKRGGLE